MVTETLQQQNNSFPFFSLSSWKSVMKRKAFGQCSLEMCTHAVTLPSKHLLHHHLCWFSKDYSGRDFQCKQLNARRTAKCQVLVCLMFSHPHLGDKQSNTYSYQQCHLAMQIVFFRWLRFLDDIHLWDSCCRQNIIKVNRYLFVVPTALKLPWIKVQQQHLLPGTISSLYWEIHRPQISQLPLNRLFFSRG